MYTKADKAENVKDENVSHLYYNLFPYIHLSKKERDEGEYESEDRERTKIMDIHNNPLEKEIDDGYAVHLVLNKWFMDIVYKKVLGQNIYVRTEVVYNYQNYKNYQSL